jgi:threonine/homoserine/homoserine lactone efflux protein
MSDPGILHFGAFVIAGLLLNLTPGPDLLYTSAQAGAHGARAGWVAALGIGTGGLVHVLLGALGVTALLAASATAFATLKLAGAAWLVWIGLRMALSRDVAGSPTQPSPAPAGPAGPADAAAPGDRLQQDAPARAAHRSLRAVYRDAVGVAVLNPKVALFFLAFVPQFIDPRATDPALAVALLGAVFVVNGTLVTGVVGTLTAAAARRLRAGDLPLAGRASAWLPRVLGAGFVALGLRLALEDS